MSTDADFLDLVPEQGAGRYRFTVGARHARFDGFLYGGAAIAVSIAAAELVSERTPLWMTTQFVSTEAQGADVTVHAEVLAPGKRTNQVRVTGTKQTGETVFASLGATGHHRDGGLAGEFERRPEVQAPEDSLRWDSPMTGMARLAGIDLSGAVLPKHTGFSTMIELREPEMADHPDPGPGRFCLWARRQDGTPVTPAMAAYLADLVPMSVAKAAGVVAAGTSLDNSIRLGSFSDSEWILLDLRPHLAVGDYGHGSAHIWSEHGHLLATASQTASMFRIDLSHLPKLPDGDAPTSA